MVSIHQQFLWNGSSGSGGTKGAMPPLPPGRVKINQKDGRQRRLYKFHVSCPPYPAAGSATGNKTVMYDTQGFFVRSSFTKSVMNCYQQWSYNVQQYKESRRWILQVTVGKLVQHQSWPKGCCGLNQQLTSTLMGVLMTTFNVLGNSCVVAKFGQCCDEVIRENEQYETSWIK